MITASLLRKQNACAKQVKVFAREWPEGCDITKKTVARAMALKLNTLWAARYVPGLTGDRRWMLVQGIKGDGWRCWAACNVPGLAPDRRWKLVRGIKDEYLRYWAACDVPGLTGDQRWELRRPR